MIFVTYKIVVFIVIIVIIVVIVIIIVVIVIIVTAIVVIIVIVVVIPLVCIVAIAAGVAAGVAASVAAGVLAPTRTSLAALAWPAGRGRAAGCPAGARLSARRSCTSQRQVASCSRRTSQLCRAS